jgi:hypothetical protein
MSVPGRYHPYNTRSVNINQHFAFTVEYFDQGNTPHIAIIRNTNQPVINTQTTLQVATNIARIINNDILEHVHEITLRPYNWIRENVIFNLYPAVKGSNVSLLNDRPSTWTDNPEGAVLAGRSIFRFDYVNANEILEIVTNQLTQSGSDFSIQQMEWHLLFIPESIDIGRGAKRKAKWASPTNFTDTWEEQEYKGTDENQLVGQKIGCAAFAITKSMAISTKKKWKNTRLCKEAILLQTKMGWGSEGVTTFNISKFVEKYPKYRLTVVYPGEKSQESRTWCGTDYLDMSDEEKENHMLFIYYSHVEEHFCAQDSPAGVISRQNNDSSNYGFCIHCTKTFYSQSGHKCNNNYKAKREKPPCKKCGIYGTHKCVLMTCRSCKKDVEFVGGHRCIIQKKDQTKFFVAEEGMKGRKAKDAYGLFVYDCESRLVVVETTKDYIQRDSDICTKDSITVYSKTMKKHVVNLIVLKDVFLGTEKYWFGDNAIKDMLDYLMEINNGRNIIIAHNASGYDSRLLFDEVIKLPLTTEPIMRGLKFIELKVNNLIFRDSMLHVSGSLRNLAKEYGAGSLLKGHFPHLFNTVEHYGYKGRIPDKKFFDLDFSIKNQNELDEFNAWYDSVEYWDFDQALLEYCIDDVRILTSVVKGYHENAKRLTGLSPWFNPTAPSFVHDHVLSELTKGIFESNQGFELGEQENVASYCESLAKDQKWAYLKNYEYWFARGALRGGRTDVRHIYHTVSDEDWDRGVRIRYQDICSEYPYHQIKQEFPVGYPTIHIYDENYYPCSFHPNSVNGKCLCKNKTQQYDVVRNPVDINHDSFFGIVCVTVTAPKNLFHPVLVVYDKERKKCVASLEDDKLVEIICTSVELKEALKQGYKLIQIHRYDKYVKKESLWKEIMLNFYIEKLINSGPVPDNYEQLIQKYDDAYEGYGIGDKIRLAITEGRFGDNPSLKQTSKIMINSMWGKHAQKAVTDETLITSNSTSEDVNEFFKNIQAGTFMLKSALSVSDENTIYKYRGTKNFNPNLNNGYIPAALFVPAYGRLQLLEQLTMLGDRVLMNDTDSIVYIYDPLLYNIPEGDMLGQWEVEKIDYKNKGIRTFVGLGPKTYAIKCENGKTQVKAKGMSLKLAHESLINFEVMELMVLEYLKTGELTTKCIPQTNFSYNHNDGIRTFHMLKQFAFKPELMKGNLRGPILYPFGYK